MRFIAVLLFASSLGCGDSSPSPQDASVSDVNVPDMNVADTNIQFDATPPDANSADAGGDASLDGGSSDAGVMCSFSRETGLSEECLPACTGETVAALFDCTTGECYLDVLSEDTTPPLDYQTTPPTDVEVYENYLQLWGILNGCEQCYRLAGIVCWQSVCPVEAEAFFACFREGGACRAEADAIATVCYEEKGDEFDACNYEEVDRCF